MTWQLKVRALVFSFGVLAALSLAMSADFWIFRWVD